MKELINKLVSGQDLTREEARAAMESIMSGNASQAQIAAFLTALRVKGETMEEISEFAGVMRRFATTIEPKVEGTLLDTCGTGGDRIKTFNISTIAALVTAGAGVAIAKHGNRSVTSRCGSADLLEALGVNINLPPREVERLIEGIGIGFMFAPLFHQAMKHAIGPRREIGIRTVFNVLGPLTNPAGAEAQLLGVFDASLTEKLAAVLSELNVKRALVVHGMDGLDEISNIGETRVTELSHGALETYSIYPEDFGFERAKASDIAGSSVEESAALARRILQAREDGPKRDVVELNAGAAIYIAGGAGSIEDGVEMARASIENGSAYEKLLSLSRESKRDHGSW